MAGGSVDKRTAARQEATEWVERMCAAVKQAVEADRVIAWMYDASRQTWEERKPALGPTPLTGVDQVLSKSSSE